MSNLQETLAALGSPIDERHIRQRQQGNKTLDYIPWAVLCRCLHHRVPGWTFELLEVKEMGDWAVVSGRLTIPTEDRVLTYDAVSSERLDSKFAPPIETAASSCLRRCCALANLGLEMWMG